jgi:hypothetical protein
LELVLDEFKLLCAVRTSPNTFMLITELSLKGNISSFFCGDGIDYCTFGGSWSKSYIYYYADCWAWDYSSFLGHLWCSCPFDLCSYLGVIGSFESNLRDMDFLFCFWFYCCCFPNNFVACWGYKVLQLLDYGLNKSTTSQQNSINWMIRHRLEGIYSVNYTMSSKSKMSSNATSIDFFANMY